MTTNYLPTDYQTYIATSRYSRWLDNEQRREMWPETVARYFDFMAEHLEENNSYKLEPGLRSELEDAVLGLQVMPSMRALMTAGPALKRNNVAGYNCSYLPVDSLRAFDEAMFILMCGTGVGFSVESRYVDRLPIVNEHFEKSPTKIIVADSKEGWCRALRELIAMLYAGQIPSWDVSQVRKAGERLKVFGGRASGPEPLVELFEFVTRTISGAKGRRLTTLECHDILCYIGQVVVVGGVRRSAMISLSDLNDDRMRLAKSGNWWERNGQRALANNSYVIESKPDVSTFLGEWHSLYDSHSGERGIFSREAARKQVAKTGRRDVDHEWGTNPCVPAGTLILTDKGYVEIDSVVGQAVNVWNGETFSEVTPFSTGINPLTTVSFSDGTSLRCTPYHTFVLAGGVRVLAEELTVGDRLEKFSMPVVEDGFDFSVDAYSQGFYSGDGNTNMTRSWVYGPKMVCEPRLVGECVPDGSDNLRDRHVWKHGPMYSKLWVPVNGNKTYCLNWLAGLLDSDGTVTRDINGNGLQIGSVEKEFLLEVRLMLTRLGVQAKVVKGSVAGMRSMPNGKGGHEDYDCKATWRLLIGNTDTHHLVNLGLTTERLEIHNKPPQRDARRFVTVESVQHPNWADAEETFCFNEPLAHRGTFDGIVTGQCSEIILRPYQFCNLSEVIVRENDQTRELMEKARLSSILGTFQSTLTNFKYLRNIWKKNTEDERLLGVSMTGILDNTFMSNQVGGNLKGALEFIRKEVVDVNLEFSKLLSISQSVATTCVKPSGTVSQLTNAASGIHARHSPYYIRTVRSDIKDPITQFLKDQGVPFEACVMQPANTVVFSFPQKSPEGAITRDALSAIEHLDLWLSYQRHWCEHKPSVTITYRDDEFMDIGAWVWKHLDEVSGISLLPHSDHVYKQAPYQECTKEEYEAMLERMPKAIDWSLLRNYERTDMTTGSQELACVAGGCEI